jgi:hypothetical protein
VLAGVVGEAVGAWQTLAVGGVIGLIALALGLLPRSTRTLARLERPAGSLQEPHVAEAA